MVNQMHRKQIVIKRKYGVANSEMHPSSFSSFMGGGNFNSFSKLAGNSRLFTAHAFLIIAATSAVRPLHKSHRGDSGMTNLQNRLKLISVNLQNYIRHSMGATKYLQQKTEKNTRNSNVQL